MSKTALYRHYDANGVLLYIGIARSILQRTAQHEKNAAWAEEIARIDVEWHNSREAALQAEAVAITADRPFHNKSHNSQSPAACIVAKLGQKRIADTLGVGAAAVSVAVTRGKLPPAWLPFVREMCAAEGIACPERAFGFKFPSPEHSDGPPLCEPKNCREPSE